MDEFEKTFLLKINLVVYHSPRCQKCKNLQMRPSLIGKS